jgi:hypothetical protein
MNCINTHPATVLFGEWWISVMSQSWFTAMDRVLIPAVGKSLACLNVESILSDTVSFSDKCKPINEQFSVLRAAELTDDGRLSTRHVRYLVADKRFIVMKWLQTFTA